MATPIEEASRRCGSRVEFSATTANTTSPGLRYFMPSLRARSLQFGGKMEETRTRFWAAIPASRKANSKEVRRSRCFPTPLVKKIRLGTISLPNAVALRQGKLRLRTQSNTTVCKQSMNFHWGTKKGEKPLARNPAGCPEFIWGKARAQNFTMLLGCSDRTDGDRITVHRAGDGRILAGLL